MIELIEFVIFVLLQAVAINGAYESFKEGNIFYLIAPDFFERNKSRKWSKPFYSCVKCMASIWGAATFWPTAIIVVGFQWWEVPLYVFDVFILVTLNFYIYKKL